MFIKNLALLIALSSIAYAAIIFPSMNNSNPNNLNKVFSDYETEWRKVDSLVKKGLPQSAVEIVNKIYEKARTENNTPQYLKAVIYKTQLRANYEEDFFEKSISDLNTEISTSLISAKPVLHSLLAELYWQYYQKNRYIFLNRTETISYINEDIKTWDLKKIIEKTIFHYLQSIANIENLKTVNTDLFDPIIVKDENTRKFRPTLYDFLAHRAIDFFMSSEPGIIKPAYEFTLNNEEYFAEPKIFAQILLQTQDTFSLKFYALNIFRDLENFHLNDEDPGALIDVTLKRLNFIRQSGSMLHKDSLYLNTLYKLESTYSESPHSALISYAIASEHYRKGKMYIPLQAEENKYEIKKAYNICLSTTAKFPQSDGAANCRALMETIEQPSLSITTEYVETPEKAFRTLVSYKNVQEVYFRIIKIDPEKNLKLTEKYYGSDLIKQYLKQGFIKEWSVKLPEDVDYQSHSVEIAMPELSLGYYIILAGAKPDFSIDNSPVAYSNLWISNFSFISRSKDDYSYTFCVLDRMTGKPIQGVNVETYSREYNYSSRKYETIHWRTFTTDNNGYVTIPALMGGTKYSRYFYAHFRKGADRLSTQSYFYQYRYEDRTPQNINKTFFFTDRAIYRPGQTIYFKGILLETDGEEHKIRTNAKTKVSLFDVNYQEVASLDLTSNEYGSVSGSFTAPTGGLNGEMYITDNFGYKYFSVEDYKRPKFEVNFEAVQGTYKLEEEVSVKGKAKAYAGNNIDGATVKYRVVRTARFPYWWSYSRGRSYPTSPSMEIITGETTTDENGEFIITFTAIADKSVNKQFKPVFNYSVTADVTDINGETRASEKTVSVGYTALTLNIDIPEKVEKNSNKKYPLQALNLNGSKENVSGEINIYKIKQPGKIFRSRLWSTPDKFILSRDEYYKLFPNDIYNDEDNIEKWGKGDKMLSISFNTIKDSIFDGSRFNNLPEGQYIIEGRTKDIFGEIIESKSYFTIYSLKSKKMPLLSNNWFVPVKTTGEPGEKASFIIGTSDNQVEIIYEIESKGEIIHYERLTLSNEQRIIEVPIKEEFRGNINVHITFVKNARIYTNATTITVPYSNKELDIKFETFRNKLQPGEQEEWKINIKAKTGEKIAAEYIAAMYDASLDAFSPNYWIFDILKYYYGRMAWQSDESFNTQYSTPVYNYKYKHVPVYYKYDYLNWFGFNYVYNYRYYDYNYGGREYGRNTGEYDLEESENMVFDAVTLATGSTITKNGADKKTYAKSESQPMAGAFADESMQEKSLDTDISRTLEGKKHSDFSGVKTRTNFNETAFFLPQLQTDENGNVIIKFTVPEALTKWKIMGFAHTKNLQTGMIEKELITQKDLMVGPNPPRFFREYDKITFNSKVSNISDKDLEGEARLEFFNAADMKPIDELMFNKSNIKTFSVKKGQSTSVSWDIFIPEGLGAITYRIVAKSGNFSDGEEMVIPVLTNRMLVTETLPLPVRGNQTKNYSFTKLIESGTSKTMRHHKLTLEFTSNPAWYAIQALPYLMEYPYECSEQVFSRYYANSIAAHIANSSPRIKAVFDSWKNLSPDALLSNLEKNQELKALVLEETPWVMEAKNESERKQRVALLFDLTKMSGELDKAERLLIKKQASNGGWPWFDGMPDSRYITQHIITGFGHLNNLGIRNIKDNPKVWNMIEKGLRYLDNRIREDHEFIKKHYGKTMDENHLSYEQIQYLYARSYFINDVPVNKTNKDAYEYFRNQSQKYWLSNSIYMQGMISLALHRTGDTKTAANIILSLKEKALRSEEMGMYWRDLSWGYYWHQAPIETQALLIEAFDEVAEDIQSVEEMKIWLLKQKQTQDWKTTKATTEACYALLLRGSNILESTEKVKITMGGLLIDPMKLENVKQEAGTGYFKTSWSGSDIKPEMGKVTVSKSDNGVAWGALYWQYFEQLDKITPADTPLKLNKKLFRQINTATGPKIEPITENTKLKVGDKITVRIELRVDRDMEYVHMKDMRASGFEPVNVMSGYKYRDGLGYYESTRDAATNFFFAYLKKGTYVFEYPLLVSHKGDFSNGITSIQCMYAPEFSAHSEGIRIKVTE